MKLSSRAANSRSRSRKLPAPIRNTITGTAIIEVPPNHSFLVPVLTEDTPAANGTQLSDTVLAVSVITVFPPHSRLAAAPALNEGTHAVPVFTVAGTLLPQGGFYDNPVRFTDISLIPRARQELRALLQLILQEMQQQAATPAAPAPGEGGQLIPVDFSARTRTSSKRAVRT